MTLFAFDFETSTITPGLQAPPPVCMSYTIDDGRPELVHARDARFFKLLQYALTNDSVTMVAHHACFEAVVMMAYHYPWIPLIFKKIRKGGFKCAETREKLLRIGRGDHTERFGLDVCLKAHDIPIRLDKTNPWRTRFGLLYNQPVAEWPGEAVGYALGDTAVRGLYHKQAAHGAKFFVDEDRQVAASVALALSSCWGLVTDRPRAAELYARTAESIDRDLRDLVAAGLVRFERGGPVKDQKAARARVEAAYVAAGRPVPRGDVSEKMAAKGRTEGNVSVDEEACMGSGDPMLAAYTRYAQANTLLAKIRRLQYRVIQPSYNVLVNTGRTSCRQGDDPAPGEPWSAYGFQVQNPPRVGGLRECIIARPGHAIVSIDFDTAELRTWSQVCLWLLGYSDMAEVLRDPTRDVHVELGAEVYGLTAAEAYALKRTDLKGYNLLRQVAKCFHPDTEMLTRSGWTKVSDLRAGEPICGARQVPGGGVEMAWEVPVLTWRDSPGYLVHLKNKSIDLQVTPDHRMMSWKYTVKRPRTNVRGVDGRMTKGGGRQLKDYPVPETVLPEDMNSVRSWPSAGTLSGGESVNIRLLRLAVAVQADGHYKTASKIELGFTEARKIDRMRELLSGLEGWSECVRAQGVTWFTLTGCLADSVRSLLDDDKTLPWSWLGLSLECRSAAVDEAENWDAYTGSHTGGALKAYSYSSTNIKNVEVLQALANTVGRKTAYTHQTHKNPNHKPLHSLRVSRHQDTRGGNLVIERVPYTGKVYCVTVPSDGVLVRSGDKKLPVVTHQCLNFGAPGGLGPKNFAEFARSTYGLDLGAQPEARAALLKIVPESAADDIAALWDEGDFATREEAGVERAKELLNVWKRRWREAQAYLDFVSERIGKRGSRVELTHLGSDRLRGDVGYCDYANSLFQGLAADMAKRGFVLFTEAAYGDPTSPVYGCRLLAFVHDEIVIEVPLNRLHEASYAARDLFVAGAQECVPDLPITASPAAMLRWSKAGGNPVHDANDRLVCWDADA